jgi:peptidoglycan/LPS O-acetylase OafA/YrhL
LLVVFGHVLVLCYLPETTRSNFGIWIASFGVTVFFTISGFLLYRPFLAARHSRQTVGSIVPRYLLRRGVRIFPAYWVALTLLAIWPGLVGLFSGEWWLYYGLFQVYSPDHQGAGLSVAWTLCTEVSFYLFLPLLAAALFNRGLGSGHRRALRWELGLVLGLAAFTLLIHMFLFYHPSASFLQATILGTFSWFSVGMVLAAIEVDRPPALERVRALLCRPELCWPIAAVLFLLLPLQTFEGAGVVRATLNSLDSALAAALLVAPMMLAETSRPVNLLFANRLAIFLGTISYGIYLWHLPMLIWLHGTWVFLKTPNPVVSLTVAGVVVAVVLGAASWYLIEGPLMRRVRSVKGFTDIREGEIEVPPDVLPPDAPPVIEQGEDEEQGEQSERGEAVAPGRPSTEAGEIIAGGEPLR